MQSDGRRSPTATPGKTQEGFNKVFLKEQNSKDKIISFDQLYKPKLKQEIAVIRNSRENLQKGLPNHQTFGTGKYSRATIGPKNKSVV